MNAVSRAGGLKQSFQGFWADRNQREQRMLIAAAIVVGLGLIYGLLIDPALSGRVDLEKRLPTLRQQAAEVQSLSKQAAALDSKAAVPAPAMTRESIETSLGRQGLQAQSIAVTGENLRLQLENASFAGLVAWLADMQRTARLTVTEANITTLEQVDRVNANLSLRQQGSGQSQ